VRVVKSSMESTRFVIVRCNSRGFRIVVSKTVLQLSQGLTYRQDMLEVLHGIQYSLPACLSRTFRRYSVLESNIIGRLPKPGIE